MGSLKNGPDVQLQTGFGQLTVARFMVSDVQAARPETPAKQVAAMMLRFGGKPAAKGRRWDKRDEGRMCIMNGMLACARADGGLEGRTFGYRNSTVLTYWTHLKKSTATARHSYTAH